MAFARSRRSQVTNYWPGFVDALSSLLLVIIFMLSLFMLTQFFLNQEILGKDTAMSRLNSQIAELTELLQLERGTSEDLESQITALTATLASTESDRAALAAQVSGFGTGEDTSAATIAALESDLATEQDISREAAAQ